MSNHDTKTRVLGCLCNDESGCTIIAILTLTTQEAAEILAERADIKRRRLRGDRIAEIEYAVNNIRFFHEFDIEDRYDVTEFFEVVTELDEASGRDFAGSWFDLRGVTIPEEGDFQPVYAHIQISTNYICYECCGKHDDAPFTTESLPLALLSEVAQEKENE